MEYPVRVTCPECGYSRVVREDANRVPADYVVKHGRETGHILTMESGADSVDTGRMSGTE